MILDDLKKAVAEAFANAADKDAIDRMAMINSAVEAADRDVRNLETKNAELLAAYKDAIMHPGITKEKAPEAVDVTPTKAPQLKDFLNVR
jgi:predicted oxidoreductase